MKQVMRARGAILGFWVMLWLGFASGAGAGEISDIGDAINKAGRQRMLTQRIVKAYCLVGMGVQAARHRKQLTEALDLFETQLAQLTAYAPSPEIKASLAEVDTLWKPFKKVAAAVPGQEGAAQLLELNDALLAAAHAVVIQLEQVSGSAAGRLVNIAGRQRMLSQRLAKFYMVRAWGIGDAAVADEMKQAAGEFEDALMTQLVVAEVNTPEIQNELEQARKQWSLYKRGLALEASDGNYIPAVMAAASENLLKIMNRITGMYAELAAK